MNLPAELRARIAADYTEVRPLPSPMGRALWVMPFALLTLVAAPAFFSVRSDAEQLGWGASWGASALQATIAFALIAAALREAIPGRAWTRAQLAAWLITPLLLVIAVTLTTWQISEISIQRGWLRFSLLCFGGSAATALPIIAFANILAWRAYPTRPAVAGMLLGLGAGLMADAGWRMFCHVTEPGHVLAAHVGGVVISAILGAVLATRASATAIR